MIYRTEHPKPQFMRKNWENLNGEWDFEIDYSVSGEARGLFKADKEFSQKIQVPFCPESKLSGVENKDFLNAVWYKREIEITKQQLEGRVILHFGAVDYEATIFVNEQKCGTHKGGFVSFSLDITEYLQEGKNLLVVEAKDDTRDPMIPGGKQSPRYGSWACYYTRSTGIWQTVWLEFVPKNYILSTKYDTNVETGTLSITAEVSGSGTLVAEAFYEGKSVGKSESVVHGGIATLHMALSEKHLWEVGNGRLYDLKLTFGEDEVDSYFGLRSIRLDGFKFLINEKSVFQRLILDQGYYPDGIYTAPSDEELVADIDRSLAMGFNGARLHEKIFEERFLYHCDCKGYIVWGEYPNWSLDHTDPRSVYSILPEWMEAVKRDYNHPAIIGWCPMNEVWDKERNKPYADVIRTVYEVTKAMDPVRPCIDASGGYHVVTDIFDVHSYTQDPKAFYEEYKMFEVDGSFFDREEKKHFNRYAGQPMFVSEYGGIRWTDDQSGWGYGQGPATREEFLERLEGLTDVLLDNPHMFGLCYTQLTDVEQEQNGLYTYQRVPKFKPEEIHRIFSKKAAIEDNEEN